MPVNTVMPIDTRALAPAPLASTSGTTPRMKANDVITIGRKRARADRDLALFDDVLLVEHEHVTSAMVATERGIWYQQRIVLVGGANAHAHEIARHQHLIAIR
jgi:hypothetical protein